jgi:hypothetical protein
LPALPPGLFHHRRNLGSTLAIGHADALESAAGLDLISGQCRSTKAVFFERIAKLSGAAAPFDPFDSRNNATSAWPARSAKSIGRDP